MCFTTHVYSHRISGLNIWNSRTRILILKSGNYPLSSFFSTELNTKCILKLQLAFSSQNFLSVSVHCRAKEMWRGWRVLRIFFSCAAKHFYHFPLKSLKLPSVCVNFLYEKRSWFILLGAVLNIRESEEQGQSPPAEAKSNTEVRLLYGFVFDSDLTPAMELSKISC